MGHRLKYGAAPWLTLLVTACPALILAGEPKPLKRVEVTGTLDQPALKASDRRIEGEALDRARVSELSELQTRVPNLRFGDYGSRAGQHFVGLRGFMNHWSAPQAPVALRIDGVTLTDPLSFDQRLFDVERVDVRVGPQGTQGGAHAPAGMIDVITRRPGDDHGWIESGLSSRNGMLAGGGIAGTIAEGWQGSLAVLADRSDGFLRNLADPDGDDARRDRNVRGRLWWQPDDDTELRFMMLDRHADDTGGEVFLPVDITTFNTLPTLGGLQLGDFDRAFDHAGDSRVGATLAALGGQRDTARFRIGGELSLRRNELGNSSDYDLSPQPWFSMDSRYDTTEKRAELYVESLLAPQAWLWHAGVTMVDRNFDTLRQFGTGPGNPWQLPVMNYVRSDVRLSDRDQALFGEASRRLDADGHWRLGAGVRLQRSDRRMHFGGNALGAPAARLDRDDYQLQPRLWLEFAPAAGTSVYAALARAGRPGGFNPGAFSAAQTAYADESMTAFDIGIRGDRGEAYEWQVAAFVDRVRDYQEMTLSDREFTTYLRNVERVDLRGLEASLRGRIGERWHLGAQIGQVHARYGRDVLDPATGFGLAGRRLAQIPKYNLQAEVAYRHEPWFLQAHWFRSAGFRIDAYDAPLAVLREEEIRGHRLVNLSAGWRGARWSLTAHANNIGNERYFTSATFGFATLALYPYATGTPGMPRSIGLSLRRDF